MQEQLAECEEQLSVANERQSEVDVAALRRDLQRARNEQSSLVDKVRQQILSKKNKQFTQFFSYSVVVFEVRLYK
jgi:predicted  nucleic acid-binding Zn-ribbon protein